MGQGGGRAAPWPLPHPWGPQAAPRAGPQVPSPPQRSTAHRSPHLHSQISLWRCGQGPPGIWVWASSQGLRAGRGAGLHMVWRPSAPAGASRQDLGSYGQRTFALGSAAPQGTLSPDAALRPPGRGGGSGGWTGRSGGWTRRPSLTLLSSRPGERRAPRHSRSPRQKRSPGEKGGCRQSWSLLPEARPGHPPLPWLLPRLPACPLPFASAPGFPALASPGRAGLAGGIPSPPGGDTRLVLRGLAFWSQDQATLATAGAPLTCSRRGT